MRVASCELQVASCELRVASCELGDEGSNLGGEGWTQNKLTHINSESLLRPIWMGGRFGVLFPFNSISVIFYPMGFQTRNNIFRSRKC